MTFIVALLFLSAIVAALAAGLPPRAAAVLAAPMTPAEVAAALRGDTIVRSHSAVDVRAQFDRQRVAVAAAVGPCPHPRMAVLGPHAARCQHAQTAQVRQLLLFLFLFPFANFETPKGDV